MRLNGPFAQREARRDSDIGEGWALSAPWRCGPGHFLGGLPGSAPVLWLIAGVGTTASDELWGNVGMVAFLVWLAWTATASVLIARPTRPAVLADH